MRVKDRYSCAFGVPSVLTAGRKKRTKLPKIHQAFGLDLVPLEKRNRGQQYKILSSFFNSSYIYPLSTICFGGVLVQAPRNVRGYLEQLYGKSGGGGTESVKKNLEKDGSVNDHRHHPHNAEMMKDHDDENGNNNNTSVSSSTSGWEKLQMMPAHFGGIGAFPYLATTQCGGSSWALNFTRDYGVGYDKLRAKKVVVSSNDNDDLSSPLSRCKLFPREDPNNA